jgi:hypothetical protein
MNGTLGLLFTTTRQNLHVTINKQLFHNNCLPGMAVTEFYEVVVGYSRSRYDTGGYLDLLLTCIISLLSKFTLFLSWSSIL